VVSIQKERGVAIRSPIAMAQCTGKTFSTQDVSANMIRALLVVCVGNNAEYCRMRGADHRRLWSAVCEPPGIADDKKRSSAPRNITGILLAALH
jgi:hypothetical protein